MSFDFPKGWGRAYGCSWLTVACVFVQGGLQEVADQLELKRIGRQHQAGSDSLLTGMAFFRMKEVPTILFLMSPIFHDIFNIVLTPVMSFQISGQEGK